MKKIKVFVKMLISIIIISTIIYAISTFYLLYPFLAISEMGHLYLMLINLIIILFLTMRLFRFKNASSELKLLWVLIFICLPPLILYYIWVTDNKLVLKNN